MGYLWNSSVNEIHVYLYASKGTGRVDFPLPLNVTFLVNSNIFTYNGYTCIFFKFMDKVTGYW